jgi:threonine/homoserine/homoserine lactone efflux protein
MTIGAGPVIAAAMTYDYLAGLVTFAFVMSITPGPNNIMLMASGLNFGVWRTLPHALGVLFGWPVMVLVVGLGLGQVFTALPAAYTALKIVSAAYMLWLAWKIANAAAPGEKGETGATPITFIQAALFQWVNGKAWFMAVSTIAAFSLANSYFASVVAIVAIYFMVGIVSTVCWVGFGAGLRQLLSDPRWRQAINIVLALSLVASLWPMLAQ